MAHSHLLTFVREIEGFKDKLRQPQQATELQAILNRFYNGEAMHPILDSFPNLPAHLNPSKFDPVCTRCLKSVFTNQTEQQSVNNSVIPKSISSSSRVTTTHGFVSQPKDRPHNVGFTWSQVAPQQPKTQNPVLPISTQVFYPSQNVKVEFAKKKDIVLPSPQITKPVNIIKPINDSSSIATTSQNLNSNSGTTLKSSSGVTPPVGSAPNAARERPKESIAIKPKLAIQNDAQQPVLKVVEQKLQNPGTSSTVAPSLSVGSTQERPKSPLVSIKPELPEGSTQTPIKRKSRITTPKKNNKPINDSSSTSHNSSNSGTNMKSSPVGKSVPKVVAPVRPKRASPTRVSIKSENSADSIPINFPLSCTSVIGQRNSIKREPQNDDFGTNEKKKKKEKKKQTNKRPRRRRVCVDIDSSDSEVEYSESEDDHDGDYEENNAELIGRFKPELDRIKRTRDMRRSSRLSSKQTGANIKQEIKQEN